MKTAGMHLRPQSRRTLKTTLKPWMATQLANLARAVAKDRAPIAEECARENLGTVMRVGDENSIAAVMKIVTHGGVWV